MRLICIGDIGVHGSIPLQPPWPRPLGSQNDKSKSCILFNWEFPCDNTNKANSHPNSSQGRFSAPQDSVELVRGWTPAIGALANNHLMDAGPDGILLTIDGLKRVGISTFGVGGTSELASPSWTWETEEGRLGILNWVTAETHPAPPSDRGLGPNLWPGYDAAKVQIARLRSQVDWIIIYLHWSDELFAYPRPADREMAKRLIELGADAIVGHHPHVVRGMETINGKPVFYSLGNYFFSPIQSSSGEWVFKPVARNRESLVVEFSFPKGKPLRWELHSYWQKGAATSKDPRNRAARRVKQVSKALSVPGYAMWYNRARKTFNRFGYRLLFRLPQIGGLGALRWLQRALIDSKKDHG